MPSLEEMSAFEVVPMEPGLSDFSRDFQADLQLSSDSSNMTLGTTEGIGPRYGIVPVPGQQLRNGTSGLEANSNTRVSGITAYSWSNTKGLIWTLGTDTIFSWYSQTALAANVQVFSGPYRMPSEYFVIHFAYDNTSPYRHFSQMATINIRKDDEPLGLLVAWSFDPGGSGDVLIGSSISTTSTTVPTNHVKTGEIPAFFDAKAGVDISGQISNMHFSRKKRKASFYSLGLNAGTEYSLLKSRDYANFDATCLVAAVICSAYGQYASTYGVNFTGLTPDNTTLVFAGNTDYIGIEDPELTIGQTYTVVCSAFAGRAFGGIAFRESPNNFIPFDPLHPIEPKARRTVNERGGGASYYLDNGEKSTCWAYWPYFQVNSSSAINAIPADTLSTARASNRHVCYGPAGSGILRQGRIYEFTFSLYDKRFGIESNVGEPSKVQMPAAVDNTYLTLYRKETGATGYTVGFEPAVLNIFGGYSGDTDYPFQIPVNYLQYRVYYREFGTFEWLPAAQIDAARLLFDPKLSVIYACRDPLALTLGAQPGGFNDYSGLPDDVWVDVVEYKGRLFWFSERQMIYSNIDNPFAYPARNSTTIPSGNFRGAIVHSYTGQASQDARLVVFAEEMYFGTFKGAGYGTTQAVPVSMDTTAQFELEGSDFFLELRSSFSAFSSRAACVADGVLYFWGPAGIFEDGGVEIPDRISLEIERFLPTIYHKGKTERIHCSYNGDTKEVIWFYPPADGTSLTKAIVFNRRIRKFYLWDFGSKYRIDWSKPIDIDKEPSNFEMYKTLTGRRMMIGVNSTEAGSGPQRPAYFDQRIHGGDMASTYDIWIKTITNVSATSCTCTWDTTTSGGAAALAALITVGDTLTFENAIAFGASIPDQKCTITAKGAGTFSLNTVTSIANFSGGTTSRNSIPVFVSSIHGISYLLRTRYWCPATMRFWGWWKHAHLIFKTAGFLRANGLETVAFKHRPAQTNSVEASYTLDLTTPNCDGYHQILRALSAENNSSTGQGLRWELSGTHTGGEWYLQYLKAEVIPMPAGELAEFEG